MILQTNHLEYNFLYVLTIILIIAKGLFSIYLGNKVLIRKKEIGKLQFDFLFGVFLILIGLFVSRILFFYFDFHLTQFNPDKFYVYPNIIVWKLAVLTAQTSFSIFLFIIDKKVLKFKLKGILAVILMGVTLFQVIYPVNNAADFAIVSAAGMFGTLVLILIPLIFIYIGTKTPRLRVTSFIFVIGIISYFIGGVILSEFIIAPMANAYGSGVRIVVHSLSLILKLIGIILWVYSATKLYA